MSSDTEVAVLFADVVGSSRLFEVLGDLPARDMIVTCIEVMRSATQRNRGNVIKTIGDEILAIFPTASDAVNAAAEMQHDIGVHPALSVQGQHVAIRIGCHFGPVVLEKRDIFGGSVHTANRMTSQAKAGQIIISADTVARLSPEWRALTRQIDTTPVRGRTEEMELFEVLWQQEDATSMLPSIDSRIHARVEIARNKALLVDQSTNGSFVTTQDGKEAFVRRDSVALQGSGLIGLGKLPEQNSPDAILYRLEE